MNRDGKVNTGDKITKTSYALDKYSSYQLDGADFDTI